MRNYYHTKEMCQMFNVGRETLRHYENIGLLHPNINEVNGYREYGHYEVGTMLDILKYRAMGFSLKETRKALYEMEHGEIIDSLQEQKEMYQQQITRYQMLLRRNEKELYHLKLVDGRFGELSEFEVEDLVFIPYGDPLEEDNGHIRTVFENFHFFSTALRFGNLHAGEYEQTEMGFTTEKMFADYLGITQRATIGNTLAVGTILDIVGKVEVGPKNFLDFEKNVHKKYSDVSKETYAIFVTRFHDKEGLYHQYVFVYKTRHSI
ncbi:MAG: MerR family transcriptional regulator [Lachnospiraceae bacterium]|nr:MerR family transcriptional regulator [Lachnospiraceae bacterium]